MDDQVPAQLTLVCLIQEHVRLFFLKKKSTLCALIRPCAFNKISKKNSWCVIYFEPSVKGKFQVLNDTVFDVFRKDLYEKVPTPELKRQGKSRMYYLFQK